MEKEEVFENISLATKYYVLNAVSDTSNIQLMKRLTEIILNEKTVNYQYKYHNKVDLRKTDKLVSGFFEWINPYYKEHFNQIKEQGIINISETQNESAYSYYDILSNKSVIFIPLTNTIEDSFSMIHEVMHEMNIDPNKESNTRLMYTEGMSFLAELLHEEYLKDKNIKEYKNPINYSLYCLKSKAIETDLNLKLIEKYLNDGYLDEGSIYEILDEYPIDYSDDLIETLNKIAYTGELTLDQEQPYIIGELIATYMFDRIMNNKYNIMELFELNNMLNIYEFDQVLDYLELDHNDIELTEESYKILEEKYKNYLKRR